MANRAENKSMRLSQIEVLLIDHPEGLSQAEIARRLGVHRSTILRNLADINAPVYEDHGRIFIDREAYLVNLRLNLHEALSIHLAGRFMSNCMDRCNPHVASALRKLGVSLERLAPSISDFIRNSANTFDDGSKRQDPHYLQVLEKITLAWAEKRKVKLWYRSADQGNVKEYLFCPYFIEVSAVGQAIYSIGHIEPLDQMRTFKIDRVERIELLRDIYTVPGDFDPDQLFNQAWGIWFTEREPVEVQLRFSQRVARRVQETRWHSTEQVIEQDDGSLLWSASIAETQEMLPWIRGWGADVEVLQPADLRDALIRETGLLARMYDVGEIKTQLIAHVRKRDEKIQNLQEHLTNVSNLAGEFADKIDLKENGELLGLLHDVGKASQEFQNYLGSATGIIPENSENWVDASVLKGKVDHSTAGAQVVYKNLQIDDEAIKQVLSLCIASHHSGLIDCLTPDGKNSFQKRIQKEESAAHAEESWAKLPQIKIKLDSLLSANLNEQLAIVFHKFGTDKKSISAQQSHEFKYGLSARFLLSCLIDADRLDTADFEFPPNYTIRNYGNYRNWDELISRLDIKLQEFADKPDKNEVDELRQEVSQACLDFSSKPKGIYQLTVPTGGGKTLSSLRFALNHAKKHGMDRIFYIIPYTSIIDQNADEVRKILEDKDEKGNFLNKVVLEHHSNIIDEQNEEEDGESWLLKKRRSLLSENWDAPIVFTTQVQFLEALFGSGTRGVRRMHQLANSVIIFDEVQTIPIKVVKMFNAALQFLTEAGKSSIVLCTATQPLLDKVEPAEQALNIDGKFISGENRLYERLKRVEVFDQRKIGTGWSEEEIAELVHKEVDAKGSVLVIVNTKKSARSLYELIAQKNNANTYHLSTRMCPVHRLETIRKIKKKLENKEAVICVSTQLIEAGVDIDFGAVIRYQAGLDSIAQAAGRCNRSGRQRNEHGEKTLGHVHIINPKDENIDRLKDIKEGARITGRVFREFEQNPEKFKNDRLGPNTMKHYYQYYFFSRRKIMDYYIPSSSSIGREDSLFNLLSLNKTATNRHYKESNGSIPFFRQSFLTASKEFKAIDSPTRGVIVQYGETGEKIVSELCGAFELEKQYGLLKKAQRYSINLYSQEFNRLFKAGIIKEVQQESGIYYLDEQYYSEETGWCDEPVNKMKTQISC